MKIFKDNSLLPFTHVLHGEVCMKMISVIIGLDVYCDYINKKKTNKCHVTVIYVTKILHWCFVFK